MISAVVFDFDGLIRDTEYPGFAAWAEVFAEYGTELTEEEHATTIGAHFDRWDLLASRVAGPLPPPEEIRAAKQDRHAELLAEALILPGVEAWFDEAEALGLPLAIASSSDSEWIAENLETLGITHRFKFVSCCDKGVPPKPAPDCYLAACHALGVEPTHALAVEDSANGIAAAKAAGLRCVAVPNRLTRLLDLSAADLQLASLADATLRDVIRLVDGSD
jgi:HAD superfamily hydrolase (TIGR01509 family)